MAKDPYFITVITVETVLSSDPDITARILGDGIDATLGESVVQGQGLKTEIGRLGMQGHQHCSQDDRGCDPNTNRAMGSANVFHTHPRKAVSFIQP